MVYSGGGQIQYWDGADWQDLGDPFNFSQNTITETDIELTTGASGYAEVFHDNVMVAGGSIGSATNSFKQIDLEYGGTAAGTPLSYYSEIVIAEMSDISLQGINLETEAPTGNGSDTDGTGDYQDVDDPETADTGDVINLTNRS